MCLLMCGVYMRVCQPPVLLLLTVYIHHLSPKDTPFEDGTFKLTMQFSEEYPNKAPTVRFVSKMFHPNGKTPASTKAVFSPFLSFPLHSSE